MKAWGPFMTSCTVAFRSICTVGVLAFALAACGTTPESLQRGTGKVRDGFGDAVSAPLEDFNIKRHEIPPALLRAEANPYDLARMKSCEAVAAEVGSLDDALGPDLDEPPPPPGTVNDQRADQAAKTTLDVVRSASHSVVPFRGWVRLLSGAERHSKAVLVAVRAGSERRAYLKGIGMRMDCSPPAAPSWYKPTHLQDADTPAPKPRRRRHSG
jgi:hypothetical protein